MKMLLIKNGLIIDGSGDAPYQADILLSGGKIAQIGVGLQAQSAQVIDGTGRLVTPGFIDIHRHADAAVFSKDFGKIELYQGITSIINGNCGLSAAPAPNLFRSQIHSYLRPIIGSVPDQINCASFESYMSDLEKTALPLNVGSCVGNGTVRMSVKGFSSDKLTKNDIKAIQYQIVSALDAGALGVTLGLAYVPEIYYHVQELAEVLRPMKDYGVPLVTHIRGEGNILADAIREVIALAELLDIPLHISHLKAVGKQNWGAHLDHAIALLDQARSRGLKVTADVYPYCAGSSQLAQLLPPWVQNGGITQAVRCLQNLAAREKITQELMQPQKDYENILYSVGWDSILLTGVALEKDKKYLGKTIGEIARQFSVDPYEFVYDLLAEEAFNVSMVDYIMDENDVIKIMNYGYSAIISDSIYQDAGIPHPRLYAAFPQFLSKYVCEKHIMPIAQAIKKITSFPASIFSLKDKGLLLPGFDADLCIFDLNKVGTQATYTDSRHLAYGMDYVIVNGQLAIENGKYLNTKSGKAIR